MDWGPPIGGLGAAYIRPWPPRPKTKKYASTYLILLRLFWVHNQYPSNFVFLFRDNQNPYNF